MQGQDDPAGREFEAKIGGGQTDLARRFKRISSLLNSFHLRTRPVLWRVLLAQAYLYRALLLAREQPPAPDLWKRLWEAKGAQLRLA